MTVAIERTAAATTCRAGLPWCTECFVDEDGRFHNSPDHLVVMDRDGNYRTVVEGLEVSGTAVDRFDGSRDFIVFVCPVGAGVAITLPRELAFSPTAARAFAAEVVRIADQLDGGAA